jgi:hypothetical protein
MLSDLERVVELYGPTPLSKKTPRDRHALRLDTLKRLAVDAASLASELSSAQFEGADLLFPPGCGGEFEKLREHLDHFVARAGHAAVVHKPRRGARPSRRLALITILDIVFKRHGLKATESPGGAFQSVLRVLCGAAEGKEPADRGLERQIKNFLRLRQPRRN